MIEARRRIAAWKSGPLDLSNLGLTKLPELPATLTRLNCTHNKLTSLPDLPADLTELYCSYNKLTSLPDLPATLTELWCNDNQLTSLPALPATFTKLWCANNKLTSLPAFPATLIWLNCGHNNLPVYPNYSEPIKTYEARLRHAEKLEEQKSRERMIDRCRAVMEELMMVHGNPERFNRFMKYYPIKQWNYDLNIYESLTWCNISEIL